jgi:adenosylcobinamide-GDP ribazoletransferase
MVAAWAVLPPARPDGMSSSAGRPGARASAIAVVGGAVLSLAALGVGDGPGVVIGIVAATAATVLLAIAAKRCIGGQTGDILGAVAALGEIAFLAGLTA